MTHPLIRWSLWLVVGALWTVLLVTNIAGFNGFGDTEEMRNLTKFLIAKGAHISIYAFWTVLTGWLRAPLKIRIFLLMFLMAHAVGTEWRQLYIERSGSLRDAALDQFGILIGVLSSFRWWTECDAPKSQARSPHDQ